MRTNLPRAVRALRMRRGWRQEDLGARAGLSRQTISRIERGTLGGVCVGAVDRVLVALGATMDLTARWNGERLDRLVDASHASLEQSVAAMLGIAGWDVRSEVSFNHYGDRGRVDILGFHATSATLLVVEVKSGFGDLQDTLGRLDVKRRLGAVLAVEAGWTTPHRVVPALVLAESRTARRVLAEHTALFATYSLRGRAALAWLRAPGSSSPGGLLWFLNLPNSHRMVATQRQRVRPRSKPS